MWFHRTCLVICSGNLVNLRFICTGPVSVLSFSEQPVVAISLSFHRRSSSISFCLILTKKYMEFLDGYESPPSADYLDIVEA